ncbi:MAG TPA: FAD-binding protein [Trebonia sp.]|jgi:L-aspartate oxidase|nr:FAD-binding protein [Trebonia sp.]
MIRALPTVSPRWRRETDVLVVGSGAAGIAAALTAAGQRRRVLLITKELAGGATPLAQGGLAAAIGPGDSAASHVADTLVAGAGLCEPDTVAALATGAPEAICWLAAWGARLEQKALRLEGGHSSRRIVHSGDDATGAEVHRALREALLASPVEILDRAVAIDLLLTEDGAATGLLAATIGAGGDLVPGVVTAGSVVLAAGGLGQAFATTSNPPGATGDALAIAARAGAELRDVEFVQFHPTVLWLPGATGQCPLITEALRGAGAVLSDLDGRPLMAGHHPRGDLAPRDVVAARMHEVIAGEWRGGGEHLWLDATALGREVLEQGFPTVTAACRRHGIDPVTEPIPVAPGAHYSCGGIRADMDGRTSIPGLYAVGEAASTGVQGANRLASNSVTEAVIAGRRTGEAIGRELPCGCAPADAAAGRGSGPGGGAWPTPAAGGGAGRTPEFPVGTNQPGAGGGVSAEARGRLAAAMSRYAGVMRDQGGLERLVRTLEGTEGARRETADTVRDTDLDLATVEATNLHAVSAMIAAGALRRAESRGCHRRLDTPETAREAWHTLVRWDGRRLRVTRRAVGAYAAGWDQVTGGAA